MSRQASGVALDPMTVTRLSGTLSSRQNRWLKRFRCALADQPTDLGPVLGLEGPNLIAEALRAKLSLLAILVSPAGLRFLSELGADRLPPSLRVFATSERLFRWVAATEHPQGIAALVEAPTWSVEDCMVGPAPLVVLLCGLQDPGNVGAIVRSARAFGATGIQALTGTANPWSQKALRASAGAALQLPVVTKLALDHVLELAKRHRVRVLAALPPARATTAALPVWLPEQVDWRAPVMVAIGPEAGAMPPPLLEGCTGIVSIPLSPAIDSLNAAVAASVLLYEAARQRQRPAATGAHG